MNWDVLWMVQNLANRIIAKPVALGNLLMMA